jgi:hypothetical protein
MPGPSTTRAEPDFGALPFGEHALGLVPSQAWLEGGFALLALTTAATIAMEGWPHSMALGLLAGALLRAFGPCQGQAPRAYRRDDRGVALCLPRRDWVQLEALTLAGYAPIYLFIRWREPSGRRGSALLWRGRLSEPLYRAFVREHRRFPALTLF